MNPYTHRVIKNHELKSNFFCKSRKFKVYLPPEYRESRVYPVLYLQDGEEYFNLGRIATMSNALILKEHMAPLIIVGVSVDKERRTSEYAPSGEDAARYQSFLLEEIIPFVDRHYATIPSSEGRAIGGSSLGATQALMTACLTPHRFQRILSQSGAFYPDAIERIKPIGHLSWLKKMYMTVGQEEDQAKTPGGVLDILRYNRAMVRLLREKGAPVYYKEKPGNHTWGFWQKDLPDALMYLFPT